ncbi:MAG: DUF99 family protein [Thermoplasmata archaeon]|nr:DUF99 family protein [Thermoplasmata archaeon]
MRTRKPRRLRARRRGGDQKARAPRAADRDEHAGHGGRRSGSPRISLGRALTKAHPRVVGVDDGPFGRTSRRATVALVVCSLPDRVDGMFTTDVGVDGTDATRRLVDAIRGSGHLDGIRAVMLDGITLGGFNVVDLVGLSKSLERPVVAVTRRRPDFDAVDGALRTYFASDRGMRRRLIRARPLFAVRVGDGTLQVAVVGATRAEAASLVRRSVREGRWPEPLRLAGLVARAAAARI